MIRRFERKLTVEECVGLNISSLMRAGVFRAAAGATCCTIWKDFNEIEISRINFRCESHTGRLYLRVIGGVNGKAQASSRIDPQSIEIVQTRVHFGGFRYWFRCPGLADGIYCGQRVGILYLLPGGSRFACRKCHNLLHRSAQTHDKRIDALLRLPAEDFQLVLQYGTVRQKILAFRAGTILLERLRKKADRYRRRRGASFS